MRADPVLSVGLGKGWQLTGAIPLDLKVSRIDYTTLDGRPYDPPYGDIHHRDETLFGLADGRLFARKATPAGKVVLGLAAGSTLPFGRTEEDPFALTARGEEHQHFQRGTGSFVPIATVDLVVVTQPVGWSTWIDGRAPLYANGKGYLPGPSVALGTGPVWTASRSLALVLAGEGMVEGRDRWSGALAPGSGKVAALASLTSIVTLSPRFQLLGQARATLWQQSLASHDADQINQRLVVSLGGTWTSAPRDP